MLSANFLGGNRACRLLVLIRYPPQMGEKSWREVASGASRACCQAKIAQATTHQRYRLCMGLQLASQAMGRGAQSRAEHACKCNQGQGLAPRIVRHRIDCKPRHGHPLIRRGEIYPPAEPWIPKTASLPVAAQQTAKTLLI